jgi:hypothetical protein
MGINLSDLNEQQRSLIDQKDRKSLKISSREERIEKAVIGTEKLEHEQVLAWAHRNNLEPIHAACHRKVQDLPAGWPDFTFTVNNRVLFIEMKVHGGKLSEDQKRMHALLVHLGNEVHITGSYPETRDLVERWLSDFDFDPPE